MNIKIYPGTLTKEEQYELGKLLFKAGYKVGRSTVKGKGIKTAVIITYEDQQSEEESEDLS
ncbi:hypothetical protein [Lacrimispora sp.]|uniref:hypothetical protein n=1 Tax=Lacrimispora sp. TaxID=2719234 RepID=UPI0028AC5BA6|nr:hypothetical protein [Lacrimispora sp.]